MAFAPPARRTGLIAIKLKMYHFWDEHSNYIPVTMLWVRPPPYPKGVTGLPSPPTPMRPHLSQSRSVGQRAPGK